MQNLSLKPNTDFATRHIYSVRVRNSNSWVDQHRNKKKTVSILHNSIVGRYRPVRVADGTITARYRSIKNAAG